MGSSLLAILIVGVYAALGMRIVSDIRKRDAEQEEEEDEPDEPEWPEPNTRFSHLTVREKIAETQRISDGVAAMETLQNDLVECCPEWILAVHIEWLSRDGTVYKHDVMCDGSNTATECLAAIAKRESYDMRARLAQECQVLSYSVRSTQNGAQNDSFRRGEW